VLFKLPDRLRRQVFCGQAGDGHLDALPGCKKLFCFRSRRSGDQGAPVRFMLDKALEPQAVQSPLDRSPGGGQYLAKVNFAQPCAGRELARKDGISKSLKDRILGRAGGIHLPAT
jgi:hypothetical protein